MNLCELPFATLSERNTGRDMLRFEIEEYDRKLEQMVRRTLIVKGDPEFGLPTVNDEEIYLGLLKYSNDYNGLSDPEVRLSRAALFELMGWPKSDWAYARLTKGMHRLVGVRLSYQNLWRDNGDKQWRDQGAFGILDSFEFRDSRSAGTSRSFDEQSSVFRWGAVLFQSFDSNYVKRIDYGLTRQLTATARRLYRYLDKHFFPPHKTTITCDVARLAYQHIGISTGITLSKVRQRHLGPAADELEEAGYLSPAQNGRFRKLRRGIWEARFELAGKDPSVVSESKDESDYIVKALARRNIGAEKAILVAASFKRHEIKVALAAMDEQVRSGKTIRDPDAWITAALANGYTPRNQAIARSKRPELKVFRATRKVG